MASAAPAPVARHLFAVDEYHRMGAADIFGEGDRVELIEGEIIEMSPIGSPHAARVKRLNRLLVRRLGTRAIDEVVDVCRKPGRARYRDVTRFRGGQRMTIAAFPHFSFRVTDILG